LKEHQPLKVCRIYQRVSTDEQELTRQHVLDEQAKAAGYYVAGTYAEKASGTTAERPELQRMIRDLKPGEVVIAEKIDRISRLPLADAEKLVAAIHDKGARLAIPGIVDLSELVAGSDGVAKIVLESVQAMLLKLALQMAREDWETRRERQRQGIEINKRIPGKYTGRKADTETHERIVELRSQGFSIGLTAKKAGCSTAQVKRIWALHQHAKTTAAAKKIRRKIKAA
jgi:DNA invertase Pin-like site-specific DNA recombinase